jgi:hypothetical protein
MIQEVNETNEETMKSMNELTNQIEKNKTLIQNENESKKEIEKELNEMKQTLSSMNINYTLIGHYERKKLIGETKGLLKSSVILAFLSGALLMLTTYFSIIFIADFISEERDYNGVEIMREKAVKSLDEAIVEGLGFTIKDLIDQGRIIHPDTLDAYNDAMMKILNTGDNK